MIMSYVEVIENIKDDLPIRLGDSDIGGGLRGGSIINDFGASNS
jgi:hypothetical protein